MNQDDFQTTAYTTRLMVMIYQEESCQCIFAESSSAF